MIFKIMGILLIGLVVALFTSDLLVDPSRNFTTYEQMIEVQLARFPDGSYQKAAVLVSRANLLESVRSRLAEIYAKSPVRLVFVEPDEINAIALEKLGREKGLPIHAFNFSALHYRNGWPGIDVSYFGPGGDHDSYTARLRYSNNRWDIVRKIRE